MNGNEWIPVTQGLPDSEITVMTFEPDSVEPIWPGYHDGTEWQDIYGAGRLNVTHWMPFPDPPQ